MFADKLFGDEAALPGLATRIAALLAQRRIVLVEHLNAIVSPVADINFAVISDFHAMNRVAEKCRLLDAFRKVGDPRSTSRSGRIVDGTVSIGAEMADIFTGRGVNDQD